MDPAAFDVGKETGVRGRRHCSETAQREGQKGCLYPARIWTFHGSSRQLYASKYSEHELRAKSSQKIIEIIEGGTHKKKKRTKESST